MRRVEKMLVCDVCEKDESETAVRSHTLKVNGRDAVGEACTDCFDEKPIPTLVRAFRRPGIAPRKITETRGGVKLSL
jgi:hypothetical protein